ncbi:ABC transporter ATP-binding protein [Proteinivorax tanatarense]|uniref:ABC transporter ATP-binding protein n=1 Tax=Proteinivorax tanatarense TaxID=1260629 RepID=A0AAU7VIK2_9FIRM
MLVNKGITEESVLSFNNVSFGYEDKGEKVLVLKDFNMDFYPGTFYAVLGPSGAGKTTILSLGGGLENPDKGEVAYKGEDIQKIGTQSYRQNNMAIVFQNFNLIHYMTAIENIYTAMGIMGLPKNEKLALDLLKEVGLDQSQANRKVLKLSGGQQQRVAIARALVGEKDLILADEPTGNLDNKIAKEVLQIFKRLAKEKGKCVIVVTHDDKVAKEADVAYLLKNGTLQRQK